MVGRQVAREHKNPTDDEFKNPPPNWAAEQESRV